MTTAIIHHPIAEKHDTGFGHPETARRYRAVMDALQADADLWSKLKEVTPEPASEGLIKAVHSKEHFKRAESAFAEGILQLDADTVVSMKSFDAAMYAAGAACKAVDMVMSGEADNAFAAMRPPGHHATAESSMGFCIFNNVAVAAKYAQNKYKEVERVAIVDWDVHHGNGTQGIFYTDPSVHFFSMHQYPWYPGTGSRGETGHGRGLGSTLNLTVKAKTEAKTQRQMFEDAINDIRFKFKPDLIMISAGFDAHINDPLGQLKLENDDFKKMTKVIKDWANEVCGGRVISVLEGGYDLATIGSSVKAHVEELNLA